MESSVTRQAPLSSVGASIPAMTPAQLESVASETRVVGGYQRSPLRYPGGKSRAVSAILSLIPADTETLVSPFFGGGSIELACDSLGMTVIGSDLFRPLVVFWQQIIEDPGAVADAAEARFPLDHDEFYRLQRDFASLLDPVERAGVFYALNRSSFSGVTLSGGMSPGHPRFTASSIERLRAFNVNRLTVRQSDFVEAIEAAPKRSVMYCDPPYMIDSDNLYGNRGDLHRGFDHLTLANLLAKRKNWILSYNDCTAVRELYADYERGFVRPTWTYGMARDKRSRELLIVNLA